MDRDRLKQVQQTDLTESRINEDFVDWLKTRHLSAQEAADLIGRSATQVKAYRSGQTAIPAPVAGFVRAMIRDELVFLSHYRPRRSVGRPRKRA